MTTIFAMVFCFSATVSAETTETVDEPEETTLEVTEEDLDIGGTSWFHNAWRNVKIFVTKNPIKKSELQLQQASSQLLKIQKYLDENPDDEKAEKLLEKVSNKYDDLMEKVNSRVMQAKENNPDAEKLNKFLDKYSDHLLKHQEIMQKLETQVPERAMEKIRTQRETHLQQFSQTMMKLENKEQFAERLKNTIQNRTSNAVRRAIQYNFVEELQDATPEVGEEIQNKLNEIKTENKELWQDIQDKKKELIKDNVEVRAQIRKTRAEGIEELNQIKNSSRKQNNQ